MACVACDEHRWGATVDDDELLHSCLSCCDARIFEYVLERSYEERVIDLDYDYDSG